MLCGVTVAAVAWILGTAIPVGQGLDLGQAHALCTSGLGQLAAGMSPSVAADCSAVSGLWDVLLVCRWLVPGAVLVALCLSR
jgi:hypothetical protein